MAIKAEFQRINNIVIMTVLEQGEEIKRGEGTFYLDKEHYVHLLSKIVPAIERYEDECIELYLQGIDKEKNCVSTCIQCEDKFKALGIMNRCIATIENYNKSVTNDFITPNTIPEVRIVG